MRNNKKWILGTLVVLVLSFGMYISYSVIKEYRNNLILVTEKRIVEAAKKCFDEEKCLQYPITLKDLYRFSYLEQEIHPLTKEIYNEESYVINKNGKLEFIVVTS